jgi:hypothetical protein
MRSWLSALWSEALAAWVAIVSAASTAATFYFPKLAGAPRVVSATSLCAAFAWANLRVYKKLLSRNAALKTELDKAKSRRAELVIHKGKRCSYLLEPLGATRPNAFKALYLELEIMIENKGKRNSTVNHYEVEITELSRKFPASPFQGSTIPCRTCQMEVAPSKILRPGGSVAIDSEQATVQDLFYLSISDPVLQRFDELHFRMDPATRKFPPIHCELTIRDTEGNIGTADFLLNEH